MLCLSISVSALAGGLEVKPYGFVKGDMVYATGGVLSFGNYSLLAPQIVSSDTALENPAVGFTAQHTRLGLKGSVGENLKVGGLIEMDFFTGTGYDANASPRIRLAYASLSKSKWEIHAGQQWDLFSPNNPLTNNTNGNMWYAGNQGFRRPQFQFGYKMPMKDVVPMLQLAICEATRDPAKTLVTSKDTALPIDSLSGTTDTNAMGADNLSGMPMIQGRLSAKVMDKHVVGVYFAYASFDPNANVSNDDFTATGFGFDFNLKFHKLLNLVGEVNSGTNLNNANLFTVAGNGKKNEDHKNLGVWLNAISKPHDHFNFVLGFGMDQNETDDSKLVPGAIESNMVIYGDAIFPISDGFSLALEVANISTSFKAHATNADLYKDKSAIVVDVAGKVNF
jgi:hypothetical protein